MRPDNLNGMRDLDISMYLSYKVKIAIVLSRQILLSLLSLLSIAKSQLLNYLYKVIVTKRDSCYFLTKYHEGNLDLMVYSQTGVIGHLCNPLHCVIWHWLPFTFDHFLCTMYFTLCNPTHCLFRHNISLSVNVGLDRIHCNIWNWWNNLLYWWDDILTCWANFV